MVLVIERAGPGFAWSSGASRGDFFSRLFDTRSRVRRPKKERAAMTQGSVTVVGRDCRCCGSVSLNREEVSGESGFSRQTPWHYCCEARWVS